MAVRKVVEGGKIIRRTDDDVLAISDQENDIASLQKRRRRIQQRLVSVNQKRQALLAERDEIDAEILVEEALLAQVKP